MLRKIAAAAAIAGLVILAGCGSSTSIRDSWRDPSATPNSLMFKKVLVIGIMEDSASRRVAEDQLVQIIESSPTRETEAVASYTIFGDEDVRDKDQAKARIAGMGFDGAVMMRLADTTQEQTWVPGMTTYPYGGMWGYYGWGWGAVYHDPGYIRTDTKVIVETMVYNAQDEKLVWASVSETFNPKNSATLVDDVARAVGKALRKEGLISTEG